MHISPPASCIRLSASQRLHPSRSSPPASTAADLMMTFPSPMHPLCSDQMTSSTALRVTARAACAPWKILLGCAMSVSDIA
eukprot:4613575-Pleurochrysis_carterae.AAC.3